MPPSPSDGRDRYSDQLHHARQAIAELVALEQSKERGLQPSHRLASRLTGFYGSGVATLFHLIWFTVWIAANLGWLGIRPFDRFPFPLLSVTVALEAIFLTTFVLISQRTQSRLADERAKMTLQMNLILEREVTEVIQMLVEQHDAMGLRHHNPERSSMQQPLNITHVAAAIHEAEQELGQDGGATGGRE